MVECPKCHESGLAWVKTVSGKNWLKRELGDGQISNVWHTCDTMHTKHTNKKYCHECLTRLKEDWFCSGCNKVVSVCDVR